MKKSLSQIMELADMYSESVLGDYLNETHTAPSRSRAALETAIEKLVAERDVLAQQLKWDIEMKEKYE